MSRLQKMVFVWPLKVRPAGASFLYLQNISKGLYYKPFVTLNIFYPNKLDCFEITVTYTLYSYLQVSQEHTTCGEPNAGQNSITYKYLWWKWQTLQLITLQN
jgi:hypothetical protein